MAGQLYPDLPDQRRAAVTRDVLTALLVVGFAVLGWVLYDVIQRLTVVTDGVEEAGLGVQGAFAQAADAADGLPVIGGEVADALADAGDQTGGRVAALGEEGRRRIERTARTVGLLTFAVPTLLLLAFVVPRRFEDGRRLEAARALLRDLDDPQRRRLAAMRAAFSLPPEVLARHTADPIGDLVADRLDGLIAAAVDDAGVRPG